MARNTQVSGSIELDLYKVIRQITADVVNELTRTTPTAEEHEHGVPLPLDLLRDYVVSGLARSNSADLLRIENKVDTLTDQVKRLDELVRAEINRQERLRMGHREESVTHAPGSTHDGDLIGWDPHPEETVSGEDLADQERKSSGYQYGEYDLPLRDGPTERTAAPGFGLPEHFYGEVPSQEEGRQ